jgi:hypothetical protein
MRQDLEKYLVKKFPLCFGDYRKSPKESCMAFGLEIGTGWYKIIKEACEKAEPIIAKWVQDHKHEENYRDWAPRFAQVKEKYGTLRLYFTTYPEGIDEIEIEAEKKSETTCEKCGKAGKLRGQNAGWYYTSCNLCAKEEDRDNLEYLENEYVKKEKQKNDK